jgi:AraC family transcriptional regulator
MGLEISGRLPGSSDPKASSSCHLGICYVTGRVSEDQLSQPGIARIVSKRGNKGVSRVAQKRIEDFLTPEHAPLPIFPCPPTVSSRQTAWNGIYLEHHHQPAYETPEYCYGWHIVSLHVGRPITVEKWWGKGQFVKKTVTEGDVGIYPANVCLRERCPQETEFIDLYLDPVLLARTAYESIDSKRIELVPRFATRDLLLTQIGLALRAELDSAGDRLYAESMANALAMHLLRRYSVQEQAIEVPTSGLLPYKLRQVIEYINDHLEQDLSIDAIAASIQMSPYYFSRLFKQSTGVSPYQYIIQCRVNRAKRLLHQGLTIAETAYLVGFANQSHLNRHFKRWVGVTPKVFLQQ